jgi:hypothetical protein
LVCGKGFDSKAQVVGIGHRHNPSCLFFAIVLYAPFRHLFANAA